MITSNSKPKPKPKRQEHTHVPNKVSRSDRAWSLFLAFVLSAYGVTGLFTQSFQYSRRGRVVIFLEGAPAWLMSLALLVGACVFVSWVVDHYDTRDNEHYYRMFRWVAIRSGWGLAASSLIVHMYVGLAR